MLTEKAVADAYGAAFEYVDPTPERPNDLSRHFRHPRHDIGGGRYTDDTQMSLAVVEALLEMRPGAGEAELRRLFAAKFAEAFRRDPRGGYAGRFWEFLKTVRDGDDLLARIVPTSDRSGAAMRADPIGLLPDEAEVSRVADAQARITHDTEDGAAAARCAALAAHYLAYRKGPRTGLARWLDARVPGDWTRPHVGKVGPQGMDAVRAALTAIGAHDSLSAILRASVDFGGDVDTVAAIAVGAASVADPREIRRDLPDALVHGMERGPYGMPFVEALDDRLLAAARGWGAPV